MRELSQNEPDQDHENTAGHGLCYVQMKACFCAQRCRACVRNQLQTWLPVGGDRVGRDLPKSAQSTAQRHSAPTTGETFPLFSCSIRFPECDLASTSFSNINKYCDPIPGRRAGERAASSDDVMDAASASHTNRLRSESSGALCASETQVFCHTSSLKTDGQTDSGFFLILRPSGSAWLCSERGVKTRCSRSTPLFQCSPQMPAPH